MSLRLPSRDNRNSARLLITDYLALAIVTIACLNLNGLTAMLFGQAQLASGVIFIGCVAIILQIGGTGWSAPGALLITGLSLYIILGLLFYDVNRNSRDLPELVTTYLGSILIIWAMMSYSAVARVRGLDSKITTFTRNVLLLSCVAILCSPLLNRLYLYLPTASDYRASGTFGNPNEAGVIAVSAFALVLARPFASRSLQLTTVCIALTAAFLTFSKTSLTLLIVVIAWSLLKATKRASGIIMALAALLALVVLNPRSLAEGIANSEFLPLSHPQQERILEYGELLSGTFNDEVSTGRVSRWELAVERAMAVFPNGNGLGSFHAIDGGLGAHNSFLMIWGESGIIPLMLVAGSMLLLLSRSINFAPRTASLFFTIAAIAACVATHAAFGLRFVDVFLGLALGAVSPVMISRHPTTTVAAPI